MSKQIENKIIPGKPNIFSFDGIFDIVECHGTKWVLCAHCYNTHDIQLQYAYCAGWYCSKACYDTLFLPCENCGEHNMSAKINFEYRSEQLCNECYNSKHNLTVATLKW